MCHLIKCSIFEQVLDTLRVHTKESACYSLRRILIVFVAFFVLIDNIGAGSEQNHNILIN